MKKRKYMTALMAGMLALSFPITGTAKEDYNVWLDKTDLKSVNNELNIEVKTDGKSTDGLLVITYDSVVLQVEEADVVWADSVERYSVNLVEEGTLKMAYLSEDDIEKGVLATIKFTVDGEYGSETLLELEGDIHDAEGNLLDIGVKETNQDEDQPSEDEAGDGSEDGPEDDTKGTADSEKETVGTGDVARPLFYMISGGVSILVAAVTMSLIKKRRRG